jgi:hypothetical protein
VARARLRAPVTESSVQPRIWAASLAVNPRTSRRISTARWRGGSRWVAFTWGFADDDAARHVLRERTEASSASAMPAGSTRVTVTLDAEGGGTLVTLRHDDLPDDELRDGHRVAWQTYLHRLVIRAAGGDPGPDPHA